MVIPVSLPPNGEALRGDQLWENVLYMPVWGSCNPTGHTPTRIGAGRLSPSRTGGAPAQAVMQPAASCSMQGVPWHLRAWRSLGAGSWYSRAPTHSQPMAKQSASPLCVCYVPLSGLTPGDLRDGWHPRVWSTQPCSAPVHWADHFFYGVNSSQVCSSS